MLGSYYSEACSVSNNIKKTADLKKEQAPRLA